MTTKSKVEPQVQCEHCRGTGTRPLTGVYAETLKGVKRLLSGKRRFITAASTAAWFGCNRTALNNRLATLERLGFLVSETYGRQRRFSLADVDNEKKER